MGQLGIVIVGPAVAKSDLRIGRAVKGKSGANTTSTPSSDCTHTNPTGSVMAAGPGKGPARNHLGGGAPVTISATEP